MAKAVWQGYVTDSTGAIVSGAEVHVKESASGAYATLYADRDGTAWTDGNPFTIGSDGFVQFYVDPERYRIEAYDGALVAQFDNVLIGIVEEPYLSSTTVTADDSATIDMLSALSEPGVYSLSCMAGTVANDGDNILFRVSTDGSTVESGASDYQDSPFSASAGSADSSATLGVSVGNDVGENFSLSAEIVVDSGGSIVVTSRCINQTTTGAIIGQGYISRYVGTGVTGIQIFASTGNILTGDFNLRRIG